MKVRKAAVCQNGGCYYHGYEIKTKKRTVEDLKGHCTKVILKGKLCQLAMEDVLLFCEFNSSKKISFWLLQNSGNSSR